MSAARTFAAARPSLEVADLPAALAFWTDVVGLGVEVTMGEPPTFAMVSAGGARLTLAEVDTPAPTSIAVAFVDLEGLDGLAADLRSAGHEVDGPHERPWGIRDLVVRVPGGPLVAFGEPLA
jgi:catechol 2,3-dioxygenase-like lactoylglutathione lyase family enzyme